MVYFHYEKDTSQSNFYLAFYAVHIQIRCLQCHFLDESFQSLHLKQLYSSLSPISFVILAILLLHSRCLHANPASFDNLFNLSEKNLLLMLFLKQKEGYLLGMVISYLFPLKKQTKHTLLYTFYNYILYLLT